MRRTESSSHIRQSSVTQYTIFDSSGNAIREQRVSEYRPVDRSNSSIQLQRTVISSTNPIARRSTTGVSDIRQTQQSFQISTTPQKSVVKQPRIPEEAIIKEAFIKLGLVIMENRRLRLIIDSNNYNGDGEGSQGQNKLVRAYESQFETMQTDIQNLQLILENRDQEKRELVSRLEESQQEIETKFKDNIYANQALNSKKELEEKLRLLEEEYHRKEILQTNVQERLALLEQEVSNLRNKVTLLNESSSQTEGLLVANNDLRSEIEMYKNLMEERNRRISDYEGQISRLNELNSVVSQLTQSKQLLEIDLSNMRVLFDKKQNAINEMIQKLNQMSNLKNQISQKEVDVGTLKGEIERLTKSTQASNQELGKLRKELIESKTELMGIEGLKNSVKELANDLEFKNKQLASRTQEISTLKEQLQIQANQLSEFHSVRNKLQIQSIQMEELQNVNYAQKKAKIEKEKVLKEQEQKNQDLLGYVDSLEQKMSDYSRLESHNMALENNLERLKKRCEELSEQNRQLERVNSSHENSNFELERARNEISNLTRNLDEQNKAFNEVIGKMNSNQDALVRQLDDAHSRAREDVQTINQLRDGISKGDQWRRELEQSDQDISRLNNQIAIMESQIGTRDQTISELREKMVELNDILGEKISNLQFYDGLEEKARGLREKLVEREEYIDNIEIKLTSLDAEKTKNGELMSLLNNLEQENDMLRSEIDVRDQNIDNLNQENQMLQQRTQELSEIERTLTGTIEKCEKLKQELQNSQSDKSEILAQHDELEKRFDVFMNEYDEMRNQFDSLRIMSEDKTKEIELKALQLNKLQFRVVILMAELERLSKIYSIT